MLITITTFKLYLKRFEIKKKQEFGFLLPSTIYVRTENILNKGFLNNLQDKAGNHFYKYLKLGILAYFKNCFKFTNSMNERKINLVKKVWKIDNKIEKPVKAELYFNMIDQLASLFSAGSFYYYILNFATLKMEYVDQRIKSVLGIEPIDFNLDTIFNALHPDDLNQLHKKEAKAIDFLFNRINQEDILRYKVVYLLRLKHTNKSYRTILHQSKTLSLSADGKIQHVLGIHTDISYLNLPTDHKISFIGDNRPSYYSLPTSDDFSQNKDELQTIFTSREKEILGYIAQGRNFGEIADILNLSPHTINTHKKNILKKTDCRNTTELIARCIREGVI